MKTITPAELNQRCAGNEHVELIDVRTPVEFQELHVDFARNVPLDRLDPAAVMKTLPADETVYVVCRTGSRGEKAQQMFHDAGYNDVVNVEGGTLACEEAGLPVSRGRKAVSLERQVRIAAGSLVLIGVLCGWLVHPAFYGLSAFVGAGLVFAGVTDTCGMAMLLARMPWNQCKTQAEPCNVE